MKEYEKRYEDVYSGERSKKKCDISLVSSDMGHSGAEFAKILRDEMLSFEELLFDKIVKISWLMRRFCYKGFPRTKVRNNGFCTDSAFGVFMRHHVGVEIKIITINNFFNKVITYLDDFFTDFDARDPFKEKLVFPFKNITLDYLVLVYQLPDRMEFLKIADDKKMSYVEFLDYVVNYISCENEQGNEEFYFKVNKSYIP
jgi:hypothetical protein